MRIGKCRRGRRAGGRALRSALACVAAVVLLPVAAIAGDAGPSGWLRLRTTAYRFRTEDVDAAVLDRLGAFQEFDASAWQLAGGRLALRMAGRFADDLYLKARTTERGRLWVGHLEARPLDRMTVRFGRQFLQEGASGLTLDGLWLSARLRPRWELRLWGGARAPLSREFRAGGMGASGAWGLRILTAASRRLRLSGSWAYRERDGRVAARLAGLEATISAPHGLRLVLRGTYDFEREVAQRAEALAQWQLAARLPVVTLQAVSRHPAIDAGSYFVRFESEPMQLLRATVRHLCERRGLGAELEYFGSFAEERDGHRLGAAWLFPFGRVGYSARLGDIGEESRFYWDLCYQAAPWIRVEGGATFVTYALLEDAPETDERDLTTAYGRLRVTPRPGVGVILEVQSLTNPDFEEDLRLLGGIDLTAGIGEARFGLAREGSLFGPRQGGKLFASAPGGGL